MTAETILEFRHITKQYPGVLALEDVRLDFRRGEVHALCGENGAGKSTLIKTCTGAIEPTSGEIILFGKSYSGFSPSTAKEHGVAVIYQEFNLVNEMTVAENIFLGDRPPGGVVFRPRECVARARQVLEQFELDLDPNTYVKDLTVGYQQLVEIAKAMSKDAKILIMDEPSAPLTNQEVEVLFKFVDRLKRAGVTVIYISHRLEEIFAISDRISVLRDGKYIGTKNAADTNQDELIRMMVGREIRDIFPPREAPPAAADTILEVRKISGNGIKNVSLSLRRGEVRGLGGLIGAGRTELAQIIFGFVQPDRGEMFLNGKPYAPGHPKEAIAAGVALVPEDRKRQGVLVKMSIREN
ncbi:MAG: sugar ABC transporter ATP-binding protein, partial [Planctomycetes bacterium]|nr:sugar ABC transporter ATP-binding protein [Planctomycetota bacterium]